MEEIKAWKTSDGKVFENEERASNWENYLGIVKDLTNLTIESIIVAPLGNTDDDIVSFMVENGKEIVDLFNKYGIIDVEVDEEGILRIK